MTRVSRRIFVFLGPQERSSRSKIRANNYNLNNKQEIFLNDLKGNFFANEIISEWKFVTVEGVRKMSESSK